MNIDRSLKLPEDLRSVPGWVLGVRDLNPHAWRLLVALWAHRTKGEELAVVYPGPTRRGALADDNSKDGRNQRRWLTMLEDVGLVRPLTRDEIAQRRREGLTVNRSCRVLIDRSPAAGRASQPDPAVRQTGPQRPPPGPDSPTYRPRMTGPQRPDPPARETGRSSPTIRSPATAPIKQVQEQVQEQEDDVIDNLVPLPTPLRDKESTEDSVLAILLEHGIGGTNPGPTFIAPIVERILAGECDLHDVGKIAAEWKRRRRKSDAGQGQFRPLFYAASWARTQHEYLGRGVVGQAHASFRRRRRPAAAPTGNEELWDEYEAER